MLLIGCQVQCRAGSSLCRYRPELWHRWPERSLPDPSHKVLYNLSALIKTEHEGNCSELLELWRLGAFLAHNTAALYLSLVYDILLKLVHSNACALLPSHIHYIARVIYILTNTNGSHLVCEVCNIGCVDAVCEAYLIQHRVQQVQQLPAAPTTLLLLPPSYLLRNCSWQLICWLSEVVVGRLIRVRRPKMEN